MVEAQFVTFDYESVTVAATAIGLTAAKYSPTGAQHARRAVCRVETAAIRYRADGTNPTTSEGMLADSGDTIIVSGIEDIRRIKFIRDGATSGVLKVSYER